MSLTTSRRTLLHGAVAGVTLAASTSSRPLFAQDDKPTVKVASTNHAEQFILAEMLVALLEDNGYETEIQHNLGGTLVAHEGRNGGDFDVHIEYIASGMTILGYSLDDIRAEGDSPEELADKVFNVASEGYEKEFNAHWLDYIGLNNSYVMAMRREHAEDLGIEKVSDLEPFVDELSLGGSQEFLVREDGLLAIEDAYGFTFSDTSGMDAGLMYTALDQGDVDVISAFATDGRISVMDFTLLEDDRGSLPPSHACPVVRGELLEEAPETREVLNMLAGKIDNAKMQELNYRVDGDGDEPSDVARDFLKEEGLIGG